MKYLKSQVNRIKPLSSNYYEIVIDKNQVNFVPGDMIELNGVGLYIASGIQEPWIRLIARSNTHADILSIPKKHSVRIKHIDKNSILINIKRPVFIVEDSIAIAPVLSYLSSYPGKKHLVYYDGDINKDWLKKYQWLVGVGRYRHSKHSKVVVGSQTFIDKISAPGAYTLLIDDRARSGLTSDSGAQ